MTEAEVQRLMGLAYKAADPPQHFDYWRLEAAPAALESALREALQPAGWQLVPKEPTEEMLAAAERDSTYYGRVFANAYRAMLSAAPTTAPAAPEAPVDARDATGRSPTDYALEFAEYLAKDAERLLEAMNAEDALRLRREESDDVSDDDMRDAGADRVEHIRAVRIGIYEFRKRRDRAAMCGSTKGSHD